MGTNHSLKAIIITLCIAGVFILLAKNCSVGGGFIRDNPQEKRAKAIEHMYKKGGDRWIAILWSIEKVEEEFRANESRDISTKFRNGLITEEVLIRELDKADEHVGNLGLTIQHVEEANNILGERLYTSTDRTEREKSFDIFTIYCSLHNPTYETGKAISLLRPNVDSWYKLNVTLELASYIKY